MEDMKEKYVIFVKKNIFYRMKMWGYECGMPLRDKTPCVEIAYAIRTTVQWEKTTRKSLLWYKSTLSENNDVILM